MKPVDSETAYLVSCVSKKRDKPTLARKLYMSVWFKKASRLAQSSGHPWFILSAEYGLVSPNERIAPYNKTLTEMTRSERRRWARRVAKQIQKALPSVKRIVMFAGKTYRAFLRKRLKRAGIRISVPMKGLRIGEQLSWLGEQLAHL